MENFYEENKEFLPDNEEELPIKEKLDFISYIPSVILTIALIALSALGSLIQFRFQIKDVVWSAFIISFSLRTITIYLSRYVGSNLYYNRTLYTEDVKKPKNNFILASDKLDKAAFEEYVQECNIARKKRAYLVKNKSKVIKMHRIIKELTYKNEIDFSKRREIKINKLKQQALQIEQVVNDEYLQQNLPFIKVRYQKLKSCYFFSPVEEVAEKNERYSVNFSKENSIETLKSLPLTLVLILLGSLISYDTIIGTANVVSIIYDVVTMVFSFIIGWYIIGKRIISHTINAYINRVIFIEKYNKLKLDKGLEENKVVS